MKPKQIISSMTMKTKHSKIQNKNHRQMQTKISNMIMKPKVTNKKYRQTPNQSPKQTEISNNNENHRQKQKIKSTCKHKIKQAT